MNNDGSRGENINKLKIKDNTKHTNKQKYRLNVEITRRISEGDVTYQTCTVCHNTMGYWPSTFCNETDIASNANRQQHSMIDIIHTSTRESSNPRFKIAGHY